MGSAGADRRSAGGGDRVGREVSDRARGELVARERQRARCERPRSQTRVRSDHRCGDRGIVGLDVDQHRGRGAGAADGELVGGGIAVSASHCAVPGHAERRRRDCARGVEREAEIADRPRADRTVIALPVDEQRRRAGVGLERGERSSRPGADNSATDGGDGNLIIGTVAAADRLARIAADCGRGGRRRSVPELPSHPARLP